MRPNDSLDLGLTTKNEPEFSVPPNMPLLGCYTDRTFDMHATFDLLVVKSLPK